MSNRAFIIFAGLILLTFILSGLRFIIADHPQVAAIISSTLSSLTNSERMARGEGALRTNPVLVAVAQAKANDMAKYGYFSHVSPSGVEPWHWFREAGYKYEYAGENLAIDFSDSTDLERAWMNSASHRENILNPKFTEVGAATASGIYQGRQTIFAVQVFGTPASSTPVVAAVAPKIKKVDSKKLAVSEKAKVLGTSTVQRESTPIWTYPVASPRNTMRDLYYVMGFFVLASLSLETGFEFGMHHKKHAVKATVLLASMVVLFVVANYLFFAPPVLAFLPY